MNQQLEELRRWISSLQHMRGRLFENRDKVVLETKSSETTPEDQDA